MARPPCSSAWLRGRRAAEPLRRVTMTIKPCLQTGLTRERHVRPGRASQATACMQRPRERELARSRLRRAGRRPIGRRGLARRPGLAAAPGGGRSCPVFDSKSCQPHRHHGKSTIPSCCPSSRRPHDHAHTDPPPVRPPAAQPGPRAGFRPPQQRRECQAGQGDGRRGLQMRGGKF